MKVKILLITVASFGLTAAHAVCYVSDCTGNSSNNMGISSLSNSSTTQSNSSNNMRSSYRSNKSNSSATQFNPSYNTGSSYRSSSSMTRYNPLGDTAYSYKSKIPTTRLNPLKGLRYSFSHRSAMSAYDFYSGNPLTDPYATAGNSAIPDNPYMTAGSSAIPDDPYSNDLTNPYAANNLEPYGSQGRYSTMSSHRGKLGKKSHGINSTSNPAPNSLNNVSNLYGTGDSYHTVPSR